MLLEVQGAPTSYVNNANRPRCQTRSAPSAPVPRRQKGLALDVIETLLQDHPAPAILYEFSESQDGGRTTCPAADSISVSSALITLVAARA